MRLSALFAVALFCVSAVSARGAGRDGQQQCKDPRVLTGVSGCTISYCSDSDFDAADVRVSASGERTKPVEGQIQKAHYECTGKSALQVSRNAEQALRIGGYTIDFTGYDVPDRYVTAHQGAQWVAVVSHEMTGDSAYDVTSILTGDMTQEMTANADTWAADINKSGRVAVYGIEFDTGKATLKPSAEKVLTEVLSLLQKQPAWTLRIEGHTDSTGSKVSNQILSEQRAKSVVAWLGARGIAGPRLTAAGLGDTKPVADNATEEGRARNRRVELVKP